ncbi:MAG: hypothetical protein V2I67_18490 [Thermoanaerobaculales bacterium]|jgi:hypothetical protein|nr:hypothetical protein [Thermoanaerobaculales bacterium]
MKSYIVFSGTGPILILTTYPELQHPLLIDKLNHKGIVKFIAYEVPVATVKRIYGVPFEVIATDLERTEDLRVLDFNGHHIFSRFSLSELGEPIKYGD